MPDNQIKQSSDISRSRIQVRVLMPVAVLLALFLLIVFFGFFRLQESRIESEQALTTNKSSHIYQKEIDIEVLLLEYHAEVLAQNGELGKYWKKRNRPEIESFIKKIYETMRKERPQISHLYLIDTDGVCYLRAHIPEKFGDKIVRPSLLRTMESGLTRHGIEIGPFGTYTLRVVVPWYIDGTLAGYIEVSEEIKHLIPRLKETMGCETAMLIPKRFLDRKKWEEGQRKMGDNDSWDTCRSFIIFSSSSPVFSKRENMEKIEHLVDILLAKKPSKHVYFIKADGREWHLSIVSLNEDVTDPTPGILLLMRDVTHEMSLAQKTQTTVFICGVLFGIGILGFFQFYSANLQDKIDDQHKLRDEYDKALNNLISNQRLDIDLTKLILDAVNPPMRRFTPMGNNAALFCDNISAPCNAEGGDHIIMRTIEADRRKRTVFFLKDESGHSVNGILKSIISDLSHHRIFDANPMLEIEKSLSKLNEWMRSSKTHQGDTFFSAIGFEIDHESLEMRYASAGHPSMILLRNGECQLLPIFGERGHNLPVAGIPNAQFSAGTIKLCQGDILLSYTDGLSEMGESRGHARLGSHEMAALVKDLHDRHGGAIHVTQLIGQVLATQCEKCGYTVTPDGKNDSPDDVTLLGVEIGLMQDRYESFKFPDSAAVSDMTQQLWIKLYPVLIAEKFENTDRILIALEEALMNAWKHGDKQSGIMPVIFNWNLNNDLVLEVLDVGHGFDPQKIADPTLPENILKSSGRGVFMIKMLADEVKWDLHGRHIVMIFSRHGKFNAKESLTI